MKTKMTVAQISKAGGDFELVERDIPEPSAGQVRIKVEACGICHSDAACYTLKPDPGDFSALWTWVW